MAVYFIQRGEDGPVKIGTAGNWLARIRSLQSAHVDKLHLRRLFVGGAAEEEDLHARFRPQRISREWYRPDPIVLRGPVDLTPLALSTAPKESLRPTEWGNILEPFPTKMVAQVSGTHLKTVDRWRTGISSPSGDAVLLMLKHPELCAALLTAAGMKDEAARIRAIAILNGVTP